MRFLALCLALCAAPLFAQEPVPDALVKHATGYVPSPHTKALKAASRARHGKMFKALVAADLPAKFLSPFRIPNQNQGNCGSCWCRSATISAANAMVAAGRAKADGSFVFSDDAVMWYYNTGGCNGDDASTVMRILKSDGLPINAEVGEYRATGRGSIPNIKTAKRYGGPDGSFDWGYVDADGNGYAEYEEIKAAILGFGSCVITVDAGSLIDGEEISRFKGRGTNHQIIVCGWDDSAKGAAGDLGSLICRNQWGTWGYQIDGQAGYCKLAAFANGRIAAMGSEEVLFCHFENGPIPPDPIPPVPPVPPTPPGPDPDPDPPSPPGPGFHPIRWIIRHLPHPFRR